MKAFEIYQRPKSVIRVCCSIFYSPYDLFYTESLLLGLQAIINCLTNPMPTAAADGTYASGMLRVLASGSDPTGCSQ